MSDLEDPLLCPVCFNTPVAEIFQCKNGHSICSHCVSNLVECPQCRISYIEGRIRNRALEALLDSLTFSCPYEKRGCNKKVQRGYKDHHALECPCMFNPIKVSPERNEIISGKNLNSANGTTRRTSKYINSKRKHVLANFMDLVFISCKWLAIGLMIFCYLGAISIVTLFLFWTL